MNYMSVLQDLLVRSIGILKDRLTKAPVVAQGFGYLEQYFRGRPHASVWLIPDCIVDLLSTEVLPSIQVWFWFWRDGITALKLGSLGCWRLLVHWSTCSFLSVLHFYYPINGFINYPGIDGWACGRSFDVNQVGQFGFNKTSSQDLLLNRSGRWDTSSQQLVYVSLWLFGLWLNFLAVEITL